MVSQQHGNPFSGLVDAVGDMNRALDRVHGVDGSGPRPQSRSRSHVDAWHPCADIAAGDDHLIITMELAGVAEGDINIDFTAPTLTVSGIRRPVEDDQRQFVYHTRECHWGRFRRTITLPPDVQRSDLTVAFNRGLLTITAGRSGEAQDTSVPIKAGRSTQVPPDAH